MERGIYNLTDGDTKFSFCRQVAIANRGRMCNVEINISNIETGFDFRIVRGTAFPTMHVRPENSDSEFSLPALRRFGF